MVPNLLFRSSFFPHKTKGEGFSWQLEAETGNEIPYLLRREKTSKRKIRKEEQISSPVSESNSWNIAKSWLNDGKFGQVYINGRRNKCIQAFSKYYADELMAMKQCSKIVSAGVIGEVKGKGFDT